MVELGFEKGVMEKVRNKGLKTENLLVLNYRVNSIHTPKICANVIQVQNFSKLTNLVPKSNLVSKTIKKK